MTEYVVSVESLFRVEADDEAEAVEKARERIGSECIHDDDLKVVDSHERVPDR